VSPDAVFVAKDGNEQFLPLGQANTFNVYRPEQMPLAAGDVVRITKNGNGFRNNELCPVKTICGVTVTFADNRLLPIDGKPAHIDQGIAVTSPAAQGKTVDCVIVSASVESFSQVNAAQFYVSMSRARRSMNLFTDAKAALKEVVARPSERVSAIELMSKALKKVLLPCAAHPGIQHAMRQKFERQQRQGGRDMPRVER
jgi:hypothetical protein